MSSNFLSSRWFLGIALGLFGLGSLYLASPLGDQKIGETPMSTISTSITPESTWKTYINERLGFQFEVPASWKVTVSDDTSGNIGVIQGRNMSIDFRVDSFDMQTSQGKEYLKKGELQKYHEDYSRVLCVETGGCFDSIQYSKRVIDGREFLRVAIKNKGLGLDQPNEGMVYQFFYLTIHKRKLVTLSTAYFEVPDHLKSDYALYPDVRVLDIFERSMSTFRFLAE